MLPGRKPITTFEEEHIRAGIGESLMSRRCMTLQRDQGNVD